MLKIYIPGTESWDESEQRFRYTKDVELELEHSLVSLSKWEETWEKPFLGPSEKTSEEMIGYVHAMCLTDVPIETLQHLTDDHIMRINEYMNAKKSATWFSESAAPKRPGANRVTVTSELIYYWMFEAKIDKSCETWHLSRLFTLLKVFEEKNAAPNKKVNKADALSKRRALNEQRLAEMEKG